MSPPRYTLPELIDDPGAGRRKDVDEPVLTDPLEGYEPTGRRGPATSLRPDMVLVIARELARSGVARSAAAKAGTTEDCLEKWLRRGKDAANRRKRSLYTQLYMECEAARAHRRGYLIDLGERSVTDRHMNPRFATWLLAVTEPKLFTVPREASTAPGNHLGPAFEMVTPEQAAASLEAKAQRFLALEARREELLAAAAAEPPASEATAPGAS